MKLSTLVTFGLVLAAAPAFAQPAAPASVSSKVWIDVNLGIANPAQKELATASTWIRFREVASQAAAYEFSRGASFDFGGGYMINKGLGVGISFTGTAHQGPAGLAIAVPHPIWANDYAYDASVTNENLTRSEGGINFQVVGKATSKSGRAELKVFGGPTFFRLQGDAVSILHFVQASTLFGNPDNAVAITGYESESINNTGWGLHGGVDGSYFFSRHVGVGGVLRLSRGTVAVDDPMSLDSVDVKVGGIQTAGGVRFRF